MATTIVNITGAQKGVEEDEEGINIESFECRYFPEYKEKLPNKDGQTRGFAVPDKLSREITIQGEILGASGLMAASHVAAVEVANDIADFGATAGVLAGTLFMDEATVSQSRSGWRSLNMRLSSDPECVLAA